MATTNKRVRVIVACYNASGEPDFCFVVVECNDLEWQHGEHYKAAERYADEEGYEKPFVAFDEDDHLAFAHFVNAPQWEQTTRIPCEEINRLHTPCRCYRCTGRTPRR